MFLTKAMGSPQEVIWIEIWGINVVYITPFSSFLLFATDPFLSSLESWLFWYCIAVRCPPLFIHSFIPSLSLSPPFYIFILYYFLVLLWFLLLAICVGFWSNTYLMLMPFSNSFIYIKHAFTIPCTCSSLWEYFSVNFMW